MNIFGNGYGSIQGMKREQYETWQEKEREKAREFYRYMPEEKNTILTPDDVKKAVRLIELAKLLDKEQQAEIRRLRHWKWLFYLFFIYVFVQFLWWLA